MKENIPDRAENESDRPPILRNWRNLYLLVLGNLAFLIVLFYILTKVYE